MDYQWAVFRANLDPTIGSEQKGKNRPVLVISDEGYNRAMPNVTILPLTSTKRQLYPSEVLLPHRKAGQQLDSIIMAHQIRTISKQRLGQLIGRLDDAQLQSEIQQAIKEHLDME